MIGLKFLIYSKYQSSEILYSPMKQLVNNNQVPSQLCRAILKSHAVTWLFQN